MNKHLLTLYTRTPLHVGSGTSVEVVDLPIMRERITNFPVIPSTSLKGVLRQECRDKLGEETAVRLFGNDTAERDKEKLYAGCVIVTDARLLAFPVRSLAGCFAWLTCPLALQRYQRDTGETLSDIRVPTDSARAGADVKVTHTNQVVLEEYALSAANGDVTGIANELKHLCSDKLWQDTLVKRLVLLSDELFQHFVTTATEVTTRIKINATTRTVDEHALFNQENVPSESLCYTLLLTTPERARNGNGWKLGEVDRKLMELVPNDTLLQIGGDETTGHGFCTVNLIERRTP